jgi:hypothetical protein
MPKNIRPAVLEVSDNESGGLVDDVEGRCNCYENSQDEQHGEEAAPTCAAPQHVREAAEQARAQHVRCDGKVMIRKQGRGKEEKTERTW